jgi:hypothetical protein
MQGEIMEREKQAAGRWFWAFAPPGVVGSAGLPRPQPRWRGGGEGDDPGPSGFRNRSLSGLNCSASSASLVQVHAMSVRMERTLRVGARSAICRHSTARCLHSTGVIIDTQPNAPTDQEVAGRHYTTTASGVLTWTAVAMKKIDGRESDT